METEFKLSFKSEDDLFSIVNSKWFAEYCLDPEQKKSEFLQNTYYDTANRDLTNNGASIRVRKHVATQDEDDCYTHTVKYGGKVENGLHQRYEWNLRTDKEVFDKSEILSSSIGSDDPSELLVKILEGIDDDALKELCSTNFNRTTYTLGYGDSIMEACFDVGKIEAGDKQDNICELELELISGDVVDLKELAEYIQQNSNGVFFNDSKLSRCIALLN